MPPREGGPYQERVQGALQGVSHTVEHGLAPSQRVRAARLSKQAALSANTSHTLERETHTGAECGAVPVRRGGGWGGWEGTRRWL